MEKERGSKIIAIIALSIAVVGLSIGFAAYSSVLTISTTSATVGEASNVDFNVILSTSDTEDDTNISNLLATAEQSGGATAVLKPTTADFTPSMDGTTISGLSATFNQSGAAQSVTYKIYAHNTGKFDAYLNSVTIGEKTCVANDGTTQSFVDQVCPSITMSVEVDGTEATSTSLNKIDNHKLGIDSYELITIVMNYEATDIRADGDFTVNFGQISLQYEHLDK